MYEQTEKFVEKLVGVALDIKGLSCMESGVQGKTGGVYTAVLYVRKCVQVWDYYKFGS